MREYDAVEAVCPNCAVGCRLAYGGEGRAAGCAGPANPNGRLCARGIAAFEGLDADRLVEPLVRGDDGALEEASWGEAYGRIEAGFGRAVERGGPDALAFLGSPRCTNEENYLFAKIARLLGTNNVDNRARICHAATAAAMRRRLGVDAMTGGLADLAEADALLVIGADPAERQPVAFNAFVRPAVNAGATLVHVDPSGTATTRLADHHLAPRPGGDAAVLTAMAAVVVGESLHDRTFVTGRTTGFEGYRRRLSGLDVPAIAADAGVDPADLRATARAFGAADRGAAITGTGLEPDDHADTTAADALLDLLLVTGNLGRRGTGMCPFRGLANEQGAVDAGCRPFALPGGVPVTDADGRARVASVWGAEPPAEPGRGELDLVGSFGDGVRAAWVFGENPAVETREGAEERLDALDCLVVQETVHTETTARADVVLPASAWAEKAGTTTNLDRRVQLAEAAADPPGNARRDLRVLCELGRRLTGHPFDYDGPESVFDELVRVTPTHAGMSYARIEEGGQRWPLPEGAGSGTRVLCRDRFENGRRRAPLSGVPEAVERSVTGRQ